MSEDALPAPSPPVARTAKNKRPPYLDARANDDLLRMLLVTVQELSVSRERIAALEAALLKTGHLTPTSLDDIAATPAFDAAQSEARTELIARITRGLATALDS